MSEALLFLQQLDPGDEEEKSVCSNASSSWSESCGLAPGGLTAPPLPSSPEEEGRFPAHPQKTDTAQSGLACVSLLPAALRVPGASERALGKHPTRLPS